jgi:hypothetical protein
MNKPRSRPSSAMVVAVLAIAFGLVGTAVAANDGTLYPKLTKSKVKKIANKQAKKQLKANVNNSHVNLADQATNADNATTANTATNAQQLGGIPAANYRMAYGEIGPTGTIKPDPPNANINTVTNPLTGVYCVDLAFTPAFGTGNGTGASGVGTTAMVDIPATNCNVSLPGADATVYVFNAAGTFTNDDFTVLFGAGS